LSVSSAKTSDVADQGVKEIQIVVFSLSALELGLPIHQVREIIRVSEVTMMPKAPKFLEGIINLRGRIIPVLDLRKRFDMPLADRTEESRILVVELADQILGLLADRVIGVIKLLPSAIEPAREPFLTIGTEFLNGKTVAGKQYIALIKLEKVFAFAEVKGLPDREGA